MTESIGHKLLVTDFTQKFGNYTHNFSLCCITPDKKISRELMHSLSLRHIYLPGCRHWGNHTAGFSPGVKQQP